MPIVVNQEVSFTDPDQVKISGFTTGSKVIDSVSVSADDKLVTNSALNEDATWNAIVSFPDQGNETIVATAHYGDNTTDSNGLFLLANNPLDHQYISLFIEGSGGYAGFVNGQHGRGLYDLTTVLDSNQQQYVDDIGNGGASIAYSDFLSSITTIENFRPKGPNHDTLNLSDTSLQTLAQVLHHTTMSDGNATIHIGSDTSVTLSGVSKAQLAAHPHDLVFTGGHTLLS